MSIFVDQSNANAAGDIVAGDKITNNYPQVVSRVERLMNMLAHEIETNAHVRHTINSLQFYFVQIAVDGIVGLEAKLSHSGRHNEILSALQKKELFSKTLDEYALYGSAQKIFAYLLSKIDHEFNYSIHPQVDIAPLLEVNTLVSQLIVNPIVDECGVGPIEFNHNLVMGMVYWLAEQCFIRWHQ